MAINDMGDFLSTGTIPGRAPLPAVLPEKEAAARRLGFGERAKAFGLDFLKGLGSAAFELLPGSPDEIRYGATAAGQTPGTSNISGALSGLLIRGPLAYKKQKLEEDKALQDATMRKLGLLSRERSLALRGLLAPGSPGGTLPGLFEGDEGITVPPQASEAEKQSLFEERQARLAAQAAAEIAKRQKEEQAAVGGRQTGAQKVSAAQGAYDSIAEQYNKALAEYNKLASEEDFEGAARKLREVLIHWGNAYNRAAESVGKPVPVYFTLGPKPSETAPKGVKNAYKRLFPSK